MQQKTRAFLKWAGGKYSLVEDIRTRLKQASMDADTLVEPFVGAGSVFLNTDFKHYILNDINADLINLYTELKRTPDEFISDAKKLFVELNNHPEAYYEYRVQFNQSSDVYERAILFLYMNRHGYNGLCRYNLKGIFNVPFGKYKRPYFPEKEMHFFAEKAQQATFTCLGYDEVFKLIPNNAVVYLLYRKYLALNERETNEENNKNSSLMLFTLFYFFTYFIDFVKVEVVYNPIHNIFTRVSTLFFTIFASRQSHEYAGV